MKINVGLLVILCLGLCSCSGKDGASLHLQPPVIEKSATFKTSNQFRQPESVLFDPVTRQLFVSNINGHPLKKDGNGFISKVAINGDIRDLHWLTGFNAPKGMTLIDDTLYIADIDQLVVVDITNNVKRFYPVAGAVFLNDVTHDDNGVVYISDFLTDTIHAFAGGEISVFLHDEQLQSPNGLYVDDGFLYVGSWGRMVDGFTTKTGGDLLRISIETRAIKTIAPALGNLDGVGKYEQYFIVTDFMQGTLFLLDPDGTLLQTLKVGTGVADLCVLPEDWELLVLPLMESNTLHGYTVTSSQ